MGFFEFVTECDTNILNLIHQNMSCPFPDAVMAFFSLLGENGIFWLITAAVFSKTGLTRKLSGCPRKTCELAQKAGQINQNKKLNVKN